MQLTEEQNNEWHQWLLERPENVRLVAEKIVPWKRYKLKGSSEDSDNRYIPISYQEMQDGSVTITCEKVNDIMPFLGGYGVFGISANDLEEE